MDGRDGSTGRPHRPAEREPEEEQEPKDDPGQFCDRASDKVLYEELLQGLVLRRVG